MRSWMMAAVVAVAVAAPAWAAEWTTVRDVEAGFTVRLPGDAKVTRGTSGAEAGNYHQVQYELNSSDGGFLVTAVKFGVTLSEEQLTTALDRSVSAGTSANGNVETARRTIRLGGVQGRDAEFRNGEARGWVRVFYRNGWLCTAVITQNPGMPPASATQAIASFQPI
ncbi:MAG TPA: hypothetical protein VEA44_18700 [Caulobacter sp.]|nr:hypothetical protein [Caulobacter sp.]